MPESGSLMHQKGRSLRFHGIAGAVVFVMDAFFLGQGVIAYLVMVAFLLSGALKTLASLFKRQAVSKAPLLKMGVYVVCFGAVMSGIKINNEIAESRAETVVAAIKQYKAKHQRFPDSLQALVPEFLPFVPRAKYSFTFSSFYYKKMKLRPEAEEDAVFFWTAIPPFGRPSYNFRENRWAYID